MKVVYSKYVKGYEFDHEKAAKVYNYEPYTQDTFKILRATVEVIDRDEYMTVCIGRRIGKEPDVEVRFIFMVDGGDDLEELERKPFDESRCPGLKAGARVLLTGPCVFLADDD